MPNLLRLGVAAALAGLLLALIMNAITNPVSDEQDRYIAEFTDVSGLKTGADVRIRGVRVGKVENIRLEHRDGQSLALVELGVKRPYILGPKTKLAVKFQALTGLRYIDVMGATEDQSVAKIKTLSTEMTRPSFDVTTLFNGLQPVLVTLSPDDINIFTANVETYLTGDGSGLSPMLDSIRKLSSLAADRQDVVSTIIHNLAEVADTLGGDAPKFINLLVWLERPIDSALGVLDEFRKTVMYGPGFGASLDYFLGAIGLEQNADIDTAMDKAFTNLNNAFEAFKRLPVFWANIDAPAEDGTTPTACTRGLAELPPAIDVLLNGQRVVLCRR